MKDDSTRHFVAIKELKNGTSKVKLCVRDKDKKITTNEDD